MIPALKPATPKPAAASAADNEGAGGLLGKITHHRVPMRYAYALILVITLALTWETNVNGIIAYASRAFALYSTLQCGVAFAVAWRSNGIENRSLRLITFGILAVMCGLVFALGLPSE